MIPYTTERRFDTGVTNVTMGIWLFLASEVMLFGALFSSYALLRVSAPSWPHGRDLLSVNTGLVNTAVLLASTACIWRARSVGQRSVRAWLIVSAILAAAFLVVKGREYQWEFERGLVPATNTFLALYFTLTGLHAVHVLGGLLTNIWAAQGARPTATDVTAGRVHALSLYWTFVDVVWIVILFFVYLA